MFEYPKKFNNWTATEDHLSFLNFIKLYDHKKYTDKGILIKIAFESENLCRIILRKYDRKVDFTATYKFIEFEKKLLMASQLLMY